MSDTHTTEILPAVVTPEPDKWAKAKELLLIATGFDRCKLATQTRLGFELIALRAEMSVSQGKRTDLSQIGTSWDEMVKKELGLARTTAYRFVEMAKSTKPSFKKHPELEPLFDRMVIGDRLSQPEMDLVGKHLRKVTDGKTQAEFAIAMGHCQKPQGSATKGGGKGGRPVEEMSPEEQRAALVAQAREQWPEHAAALTEYGLKFLLLEDQEIDAQISALEGHLKFRRDWLRAPKAKRDAKAMQEAFDEAFGGVTED